MKRTSIILVHTGNEFPDYLNDCVLQLKKYEIDIHLIISKKLATLVHDKDINISFSEDYETVSYKNFKVLHNDQNYRDGFWTRTSSRFFLIECYARRNNIKSFFHIETDVLLYSNLISEKNILDKSNYEMSLIMDSDSRCVPSLIWFKDYGLLSSLCNHLQSNNRNDDMFNLALFYKKNISKILNLPISPKNDNNSPLLKYNNMSEEFGSIFDGAAIGQFLGGIYSDPNIIGFVNKDCSIDYSKFKFKWINKEPFILFEKKLVKINNLHIHSKQLNKFI
jgi:hypothetical protein